MFCTPLSTESVDNSTTLALGLRTLMSPMAAAAFLARNESAPISMRHVMHAARRELAKRGQVIRMGELER